MICFLCDKPGSLVGWQHGNPGFGCAYRAFIFKHDDTTCTKYFELDQERAMNQQSNP